MEDKQILELIVQKLNGIETTLNEHSVQLTSINERLDKLEKSQETVIQKVDGITEQLGKVSELEPVVQKFVKDVSRIDSDLIIVKKFITS